jgi:hypothetical protein
MSTKEAAVETSFLGLGGTTKDVVELYNEAMDLYEEQFKAFEELFALRDQATAGTNEAYYGTRGNRMVKTITELAARIANRNSKFRVAYNKEVKEHNKRVEEEHKAGFKSADDLRKKHKKRLVSGTVPEAAEEDEDENVTATVAMVRDMLKMKL